MESRSQRMYRISRCISPLLRFSLDNRLTINIPCPHLSSSITLNKLR